mmetsp:Transcript_138539/g.196109  ORF Transcript_138539/g.196109 Transcript_138539/m.196109 type:complete len:244 (+) Transcript_138539:692-1423(+)
MGNHHDNHQVDRKERLRHHTTPELRGHRLFVEQLSKGTMHDEHGEGERAEPGHRAGAEEACEGMGLPAHAVPVHRHDELGVERHEQQRPDHGVVEVQRSQPESQGGIACEEEPERILRPALLIEHDISRCHYTFSDLHESREGMEAGDVPEIRMRWLLLVPSAAVELPSLRVGELLEQRHGTKASVKLAEAILAQPGHLRKDKGRHREVRKRQSREEPRRRVPDLSRRGEPGLQQEVIEEGVQ